MTGFSTRDKRALLLGLDPALEASLAEALGRCNCVTLRGRERQDSRKVDIIFCSSTSEDLLHILSSRRRQPVVVVSRLPEVDGWLDALEAGAADYCAPPFEPAQIRWLIEAHTSREGVAAA